MYLSIIVPSYNTKEITLRCLESLVELNNFKAGQDFEVIIVDNASLDGSVDEIRQSYPQFKLIANDANLGYSKANNIGIKSSSDTPYVLFLNSDTVVPEDTLNRSVQYMDQHPDIGVLSCKVELWSGELDLDAHRGFPTPWVSITRLLGLNRHFPKSRLFNKYNQGWKDMNQVHDVDSVVGAFMLVRRSVGESIGWWDEDYFLNGEDIDFCYRVKEKGFKVVYYPDVKITHYRGASKGTRVETQGVSKANREGKLRVANASVNSMRIFYDKHLRSKYPKMISMLVDLGIVALHKLREIKVKLKTR